MNANFSPRHSRSSCYLAPTPPRRKRSNDLDRILRSASVPTHLQLGSCCNDPRNTIFCDNSESNAAILRRGRLQREKRTSKLLTITTSSSMMFDHASQQRRAATKAIVIPRANSCDMKPSLPTRKATPVKSRLCIENNFSWNHPSAARKFSSLNHHQSEDEERSAAIRKPSTKTNMFLQNISSSLSSSPSKALKTQGRSSRDLLAIPPRPKYEHRTPPTDRVKMRVSPNSVQKERRLNSSARKEHLMSRWESSPSLSSAPSCVVECFSEETTRLESSTTHQQRGVSRNNSSFRLEAIML